jgi:hypothetical protein
MIEAVAYVKTKGGYKMLPLPTPEPVWLERDGTPFMRVKFEVRIGFYDGGVITHVAVSGIAQPYLREIEPVRVRWGDTFDFTWDFWPEKLVPKEIPPIPAPFRGWT